MYISGKYDITTVDFDEEIDLLVTLLCNFSYKGSQVTCQSFLWKILIATTINCLVLYCLAFHTLSFPRDADIIA